MHWQAFIGLYYLTAISKVILLRLFLTKNKLDSRIVAALVNLAGFLPAGIIVGLYLKHDVAWSGNIVALLLLQGALIGTSTLLFYAGLQRLTVIKYQAIGNLLTVFTVVLGSIFLAERLSFYQLIGGALILISVYLVILLQNITKRSDSVELAHKNSSRSGILLTLLGTIILTVGLIIEKICLQEMEIGAYFIWGFSAQTLFTTLLAIPVTLKIRPKISVKQLLQISTIGTITAASGMFYLMVLYLLDNISVTIALTAFVLPLTALASFIFLKERKRPLLTLMAIFVGVFGIILSSSY